MNPFTNIPEIDEYLKERIKVLPSELSLAINDDSLFEKLSTLLKNRGVVEEMVENIKYEVLLILLRLVPFDELPTILMSEYDFDLKNSVEISKEIETNVLSPYLELLTNLSDDELVDETSVPAAVPDTKERLDLRPQGIETVVPEIPKAPVAPQQGARPLTREELMNALSPKRTMATDIEAMRQKQEVEKPKESFPGYEAFRKLDEEKK